MKAHLYLAAVLLFVLVPSMPAATTSAGESRLVLHSHLLQNTPNPFNPGTEIRFHLPWTASVSLQIYNILGQEIRTLLSARLPSGEHQAEWDGTDNQQRPVVSGMYFYQLVASPLVSSDDPERIVETRKMVMMR